MWRGIPTIKTCTCGRMKRYRKPAWMDEIGWCAYHDWLWYDSKWRGWGTWYVSTRCPDCGDTCDLFGGLRKRNPETAYPVTKTAIPEANQRQAGIS